VGELGEGGVLVEGSKSAFLLRCVVRYDEVRSHGCRGRCDIA